MRRFLAICLLSLSLLGCDGTEFVEKQSETASEGAYGVPVAINNGRIDQADSISKNLQTLYSPPKTPIVSNPVIDPKTGLPTVILPARLSGKVFVIGSIEYQDLLKNKQVAEQLAKDNKDLTNYKVEAEKQKVYNQGVLNDLLVKYNALKAQLDKYKASLFYKAYIICHSLIYIIPISIVAIIALVIFCPAIGVPLITLLGTIWGLILNVFNAIVSGISFLFNKN